LIFFFILLGLQSCNNNKNELPPSVASISKEYELENVALEFTVSLYERLNEVQLKNLGQTIYNKYDGENYKKVSITYNIGGAINNMGGYATTIFNPSLTVKLYGLSKDEIKRINPSKFKNEKYFWYDDVWKSITLIQKEKNQFYLRKYYSNLTNESWKLNIEINGFDTIYKVSEKFEKTLGVYYKINRYKELEEYNDQGYYFTMTRD
jgi:hypothetical protein